jgi:hypothetical protein
MIDMKDFKLRTLLKAILLTGISVILSSSVLADSSSYYDKDGATVFPIENKSIVMKEEIVKIEPTTSDYRTWRAICEFNFFNKSTLEESVTMGYPDWLNRRFELEKNKAFWNYFNTLPAEFKKRYDAKQGGMFAVGYGYDEVYIKGYKEGKLPYISNAWNLHDLKVIIDGEKPKTTHKAIIDKRSLPGDGAYIWKVIFKPHETKTVRVSFSFRGFTDEGDYQKVSYVLRTGALWADNIGVADIYWNIKGRDIDLKQVIPHGYKIENNIIHWHFEDFEPKEDIFISRGENPDSVISVVRDIYRSKQYEGDTRYYINDDLENKDLEKNLNKELQTRGKKFYVKALRNEIYARHGREFNSIEILDVFGNCDWYEPNKNYSDTMLNEYEKKNIKFILDYEKHKGFALDSDILTEEEQQAFATFKQRTDPWESPTVFSSNKEALKYLKILVKGDHQTIKWYSDNNDLPTEEDKKQTYSEDISTALYNFFPRSNKEEVFDVLVKILQTKWEYPEAMEEAAVHIRFVQDPKIIQLLLPLLKHPNAPVRREAAASLYELNEADAALPVLEELIQQHSDSRAMVHLFEWKKGEIVKFRDDRGYNILLKAMGHKSVYVRVQATSLLYDAKRISKENAEKVAIDALIVYKPMREYGLTYDSRGELIPTNPIDGSELKRVISQWGLDKRAYIDAINLLGKLKSDKAIPILEKFANQVEDNYTKRHAKEYIEIIRRKQK